MEEEITLEQYLARSRVIDKLIKNGLWQHEKTRRLICAIYGTEEQCDDFLLHCSNEDIETILIDEGMDIIEFRARTEKMLAELRERCSGV